MGVRIDGARLADGPFFQRQSLFLADKRTPSRYQIDQRVELPYGNINEFHNALRYITRNVMMSP